MTRRGAVLTAAGLLILGVVSAPGAATAGVPDPDWHIPAPPVDAPAPVDPAYLRLLAAADAYRVLAANGGWAIVPPGPLLQAGGRDARVVALRNRLRATGEFSAEVNADPWFFDGALLRAVQVFQARHGVPATGAVDERTRDLLNVSAAERLRQLEITAGRWRWLPRTFPERYLWVNVPESTLELREHGTAVITMRVIAGHPDRPTPSFVDEITAVDLNPAWSVPRRIAVEDLLPAQQADPDFLRRLGIRVLPAHAPDGRPRDPSRIDWAALGPERFPWRLRQDPGPANSLGRYRFVMDNPWDIFLHDTPSRRLFDLQSRTLSSGCIRLEDPEALVAALLGTLPAATAASRRLRLPQPIPIYVVYLTSRVTDDGVVHFRPDVYGRDARLR